MREALDNKCIDILLEEFKELSAQNCELMEALRMVYGWYIAPAGTMRFDHLAYPKNNNGSTKALKEHVKRIAKITRLREIGTTARISVAALCADECREM